MPIVEVTSFPASEAFLSNATELLKPANEFIQKNVKGMRAIFYGIQVQDPKIGYFAIIWESYEHFKAVQEAPIHTEFLSLLVPYLASGGNFDIQFVEFKDDSTAALSAPVTELATLELNSGTSRETVEAALAKLAAHLNDGVKVIHPPVTFGPSREHANRFVLTAGWDSLEANKNYITGSEESLKILGEIKKLGEVTGLVHVKFQLLK